MIRALPILALAGALSVSLVACGSPEPAPSPTPTETPDAGPKTLVAAPLADLKLGLKIEGPQGPEVTGTIAADDGTVLGSITSYVACPANPDTGPGDAPSTADHPSGKCDPASRDPGTVYTYVHAVTLGDPDEADTPSPDASPPSTMVFRMTRPAHGFANVIGFDAAQAEQTLGEDGEIKVQVEDESLIWRVVAGDGWQKGETLTFFWQTTAPPAGPADAYILRIDDVTATVRGPFPGAPENAAEGESAN